MCRVIKRANRWPDAVDATNQTHHMALLMCERLQHVCFQMKSNVRVRLANQAALTVLISLLAKFSTVLAKHVPTFAQILV